MSFSDEPEFGGELRLTGLPKRPEQPKERGRWSKFCRAFLDVCENLGEAARGGALTWAKQQSANLKKTESEVTLNNLQANKLTMEIQQQLEQKRQENTRPVVTTVKAEEVTAEKLEKEISQDIAAINEKIESLRLLRGTEIKFLSRKPVGKSDRP